MEIQADLSLQRIIDYLNPAEKVVEGLRGVNKKLEDMFDDCLAKGRSKYGLDPGLNKQAE